MRQVSAIQKCAGSAKPFGDAIVVQSKGYRWFVGEGRLGVELGEGTFEANRFFKNFWEDTDRLLLRLAENRVSRESDNFARIHPQPSNGPGSPDDKEAVEELLLMLSTGDTYAFWCQHPNNAGEEILTFSPALPEGYSPISSMPVYDIESRVDGAVGHA